MHKFHLTDGESLAANRHRKLLTLSKEQNLALPIVKRKVLLFDEPFWEFCSEFGITNGKKRQNEETRQQTRNSILPLRKRSFRGWWSIREEALCWSGWRLGSFLCKIYS